MGMKILKSTQVEEISDPVRSKLAMVIPVLEASLHSLNLDRIERLGGLTKISLWDLAREFKEGAGDAGICFEYAVHDAIAHRSDLIYPYACEVLKEFCNIEGGADSILFGPEKGGTIPILESTQESLTEESRVYVGNAGRPPKLKQYIPQIVRAFRRNEERNRLPRSIMGLWKADLFIGSRNSEQWVGTTVKINPKHLEGAKGLRIGIYPRIDPTDQPRKDQDLNLIRLPLAYDQAFMELYYKAFFLTKAFLRADAKVPPEVSLPDAEDRYITHELENRRRYPILDILDVLRNMSQKNLLDNEVVTELKVDATLSPDSGLVKEPQQEGADFVSLSPKARKS
jgi:hypothetical protein